MLRVAQSVCNNSVLSAQSACNWRLSSKHSLLTKWAHIVEKPFACDHASALSQLLITVRIPPECEMRVWTAPISLD
jgi:hypothetical protein